MYIYILHDVYMYINTCRAGTSGVSAPQEPRDLASTRSAVGHALLPRLGILVDGVTAEERMHTRHRVTGQGSAALEVTGTSDANGCAATAP